MNIVLVTSRGQYRARCWVSVRGTFPFGLVNLRVDWRSRIATLSAQEQDRFASSVQHSARRMRFARDKNIGRARLSFADVSPKAPPRVASNKRRDIRFAGETGEKYPA